MSVRAYLALGSNLGDRQGYLDRALRALQEHPHINVLRTSPYHETAPVGGPAGQGAYLNAAAEIETDLEPADLLRTLLEIEKSLGRVRVEYHGPRTIDLDLLLYGDLVRNDAELTIPHPRLHERAFVLLPLVEIAPAAIHPVLRKTVRQLYDELEAKERPQKGQPTASPLAMPRPAASARELTGLRALVTGATSGIGRAIALALAGGGADVIVHGRRSQAAEQVVAEVQGLGVNTHCVLADLREPRACGQLVETAWDSWGPLHVWINNAGADTLTGEAPAWPYERKLLELFEVDVRATMLLSRDVGRRMKRVGTGVIVNMGWDQADVGMEGDSGELFAATKAAVMAFSKSLAVGLAPEVRVNCLAPGWIQTAWGKGASSSWQERVRRETLLRRWGTPEDVATTARWLVSPAAAFLTGQVIRVNGGAVR